MSTLDLYRLPLTGTQLIEASAGTGKTWTIAGLYLRLLLESERDISEILVVTFTRAATAELRERLRERIVQVEYALTVGEASDEFGQWALDSFAGDDRFTAMMKLYTARRRFDEAAIFTIHGFCQRVLTEAQLPALLAEPEIVPDERDILPLLLQEAWIRHCNDDFLVALLQENGVTLDVVADDIRALLRKPYLLLQSGGDAAALEKLRVARAALREAWQRDGEAIRDDLRRADGLSQAAKDGYKDVDDLLGELDGWLQGEPADMHKVARLTHSAFQASSGRKKNGSKPTHGFWKQLEAVLEGAHDVCQHFRRQLIDVVQAALREQKEQQGLVTYQDLLCLLSDAVADAGVVDGMRRRFSAALIDEFQDTDPLQFRIFENVYHAAGLPLFLVGDPKQAIYSFRGADVFTYLRARANAAARHTLDTNRRSLPPLVAAVNGVFAQNTNAFLFSDLRFQAVKALPPALAPTFVDGKKALHCTLLPAAEKSLSKEKAAALSAAATAEDIVALLQAAAEGRVMLPAEKVPGSQRPLAPPDIAVLVPTHRQAQLMAEALTARGVAVIQRSEESVFATPEAWEFRNVLEAVIAPGREGLVKAALLGTLLGWSVEELHEAQQDDLRWSRLSEQLLQLRERWQRQGFMAMWAALLAEFAVAERLLALSLGERRLTNLRHLAWLLQREAEHEPVPERQLAWLREQLLCAEKGEDNQLRLESDAERVQILTVHVSKGLEYPVVFCPFLWDGRSRDSDERAEYRRGAESVLDIGSPEFDRARERMNAERLAENLRVLYVALTRAKYRCEVVWGACRDSELAALSWLLLGQGVAPEPDDIRAALKGCTRDDHAAALEKLAAVCSDGFSWRDMGEPGVTPLRLPPEPLHTPVLPDFDRRLPRRWRVSSFTGLSAGGQLDPDDDWMLYGAADTDVVPQGLHAFPRGAQAGVFWHELLEESVMGRVEERSSFVAARMKKFGIEPQWQGLVEASLAQWLETPLGEERLRLGHCEAARAEMEFFYPVRGLRPDAFLELPEVPAPYRAALQALDFATLNGYLKGYIDLICRHDGRYYVIDYKTNWLGPDDASYGVEALERAVAESHYYLQYWLYTLALHRHLRATLKERYDYERDVGGVRYFFLRGLHAATQGVYARKPSRRLIEALDRLMEGRA